MPRALSDFTEETLRRLWYRPWASAADIVLDMQVNCQDVTLQAVEFRDVDNALAPAVARGWLLREKLGRIRDLVWRYVFSEAGVEEMHRRFGWPIFWWHTAKGVRDLSRRLELVELAYLYLPQLWRSNLISNRRCYVYRDRLEIAGQTGEPVMRSELVGRDWRYGRLVEFHWMDKGPFELIVTYDDGGHSEDRLHLPILLRTDFQKKADSESLMRDRGNHLVQDERWLRLPQAQAESLHYRPGAVVFSPNRVSAAMAQRHWLESLTGNNATTVAIMDAQGQVVRQMNPPTAWWRGFQPPSPATKLGDISGVVEGLKTGAYAAVNGTQSWGVFRSIDRAPAVKIKHIEKSAKVPAAVVVKLVKTMEDAKVITAWRGGHYLNVSGRGLLADSERGPTQTVRGSREMVDQRWDIFTKDGSTYRGRHRIHNEGQADVTMFLRQHGYPAFPALGVVIEYFYNGQRVRVDPDGFVVLEPGVLVAVEYERSSKTPTQVRNKVGGKLKKDQGLDLSQKYVGLREIGFPIPSLIITDTTEAAKRLAELRFPYLLAASLDAVRKGPHGQVSIGNGEDNGTLGCWWYWYSNSEGPTADTAIDLVSTVYAQKYPQGVWRLPVDRTFRSDLTDPNGGRGR